MPTSPASSTCRPRVWSAYGTAVSAWRGLRVVQPPVPEGKSTAISSQRASPSKTALPKSRETVNRPSTTSTRLTGRVVPTWVPPLAASHSESWKSAVPVTGEPDCRSSPW